MPLPSRKWHREGDPDVPLPSRKWHREGDPDVPLSFRKWHRIGFAPFLAIAEETLARSLFGRVRFDL